MSAPPELNAQSDIAHLCRRFLLEDPDAQGWAFLYPDEEHWESPDCDVMSRRFIDLARSEGFDAHLVHASSIDEGDHWFAVIQLSGGTAAIAVDWTAKQFYTAGHPAPPTDPDLIPCPLVFRWPGRYPLDVVEFELTAPAVPPTPRI